MKKYISHNGVFTEIGGGYYLFTPNLRNEPEVIFKYD